MHHNTIIFKRLTDLQQPLFIIRLYTIIYTHQVTNNFPIKTLVARHNNYYITHIQLCMCTTHIHQSIIILYYNIGATYPCMRTKELLQVCYSTEILLNLEWLLETNSSLRYQCCSIPDAYNARIYIGPVCADIKNHI